MNSITLKAGREASLLRKHHWIFSGALASNPTHIKDGETIQVFSHTGESLGYGHFSNANISVRMIQFGGNELDQSIWYTKIAQAFRLRQRLGLIDNKSTNAYRLVHGEGDELPGLIIDIYDQHAVIQCHTLGMHQHIQAIAQALESIYADNLLTIYDKSKESLGDSLAQMNQYFIKGNTPEAIIVENNNKFKVNWVTGQKTGFFIDQRENRNLLGTYSKDKSVLNLFCYSGGFSIYALNNRAKHVDSVDVSAKAMELTDANISLLADGYKHQSFTKDVNSFIASANEYDIIVCDPPAFAKSINKRHQALNGYKNLNAKVLKKIKSGGLLFTFSCSQVMDRELFQQTILSAAYESNRKVKILHQLSQSPDHPINLYHPEGSYLKGLVLYIED